MGRTRLRQLAWPCAALLLAVGCQAPPGQPPACGSVSLPRPVYVAGLAVRDTAVNAVFDPRRSARETVTEPVAYLGVWAAGLTEKRIGLRLLGTPEPVLTDRPTLDPNELEEYANRSSGAPPSPAGVRLFIDGGEALAALEGVIAGATCRLDVLMYLWGGDEIGWRVARQLAAKAGPGLPVRVLVDSGGNMAQGEPRDASAAEVNAAVCWLAQQPYVTVVRTRNAFVRFDHRKLVVADGRVAWSGGRNFLDSAFLQDHDLSYTVTGPLVAQMTEVFEDFWHDQGGQPALPAPAPTPPEDPNALARLVRTGTTSRTLTRVLYEAVGLARHHVYLENPYFSDNHLLYLLARARQRGADVRVVLTLNGDSRLFNRANRVTANRLLRAGCRVYLYPGLTHVKALAVDGVWAYTGSGNFDNLSLRHNRELGLAISDGPLIRELEGRLFEPDFRPEWELTEPLPLSALDYLYEFAASAAL